MENPLVSVVIPIYNTPANLLEVCVESVLNQSYRNIELLLVDDGSKLNIAAAIDDVAANDARVTVFHCKNGGVSAARNFGLRMAVGDYVMFVDSDDVLADEWISISMYVAIRFDADVTAGIIVNTDNIHVSQHPKAEPRVDLFEEPDFWRLQERFFTSVNRLGDNEAGLDAAVYSKLIKSSCLGAIEFPEGVAISEDQVFNHALLRSSHRYALVSTPSYYYYENPSSVTHTFRGDALHAMMLSMGMVKQFVYDRNETWQAFYYRVLGDAITAFQWMAFSGSYRLGFSEKLECLRSSSKEKMYQEALSGIKLAQIPSLRMMLKVFLLKFHFYRLYIFLKDASKVANS